MMYIPMIKKIQRCIQMEYEIKLTLNCTQFYGYNNTPINRYKVNRVINNKNYELYQDTSLLRVMLFFRDYLYTLKGTPLPADNEEWVMYREAKASKVFNDLKLEMSEGEL